MEWFDDSTDFSSWGATDTGSGFDYIDTDWGMGSYSPQDYSGFADFSGATPWQAPAYQPPISAQGSAAPGVNGGGQGGSGGLLGAIGGLPGILGGLGALAGGIGGMIAPGRGASQQPMIGTAQKAQIEQANQAMQPFMAGQSPLQQMQMSLLQALASGQGLPPGYEALVEQAFQPKLGDLYTQATQAGRARGFHDAPGTSPAGGAVLGPGLANLQGQMAAAKLGLMQSLPQMYNQPIASQMNAAQNQSQSLLKGADLGIGQQVQGAQPGWGQVIGSVMQGVGGAMEQQSQQKQFQDMLQRMQGGITLSGQQPRY